MSATNHSEDIEKDVVVEEDVWLGTNVSRWLERDNVLSNCVKFIDINTIKINNSEHILQKIINKINGIKNLG